MARGLIPKMDGDFCDLFHLHGYHLTMDMQGLQSGTTAIETTDILKDFMMTLTQMGMQMHILGAMFAPHDKITLMAMTSYQQRHMARQGAHHYKEGHHLSCWIS